MKRMIPIVDLATGAITDRPSNTPTLDLPEDFDRTAGVEMDTRSRVQYRSVSGKSVVCPMFPRPLSWRVHGEECLVSDEAPGARDGSKTYTLSTVE
ncbi:MAG: hypothetical protein ACXWLR_14380 [Myxococcales bacterium]